MRRISTKKLNRLKIYTELILVLFTKNQFVKKKEKAPNKKRKNQ